MRVCLVTPFAWSQPHDVNDHVAGVATGLRALGHEVTVIAPSARATDLLAGRRAIAKGERAEVIAVGAAIPISRRSQMGVPVGVRANLRLIDVRTGRQIWTSDFEEKASDILKLQDSISGRVAQVLLIKLRREEELLVSKSATSNPEAYQLYLTGREKWMRREWDRDCLAFYRKAIELDPNFALPYLGIADLYAFFREVKICSSISSKEFFVMYVCCIYMNGYLRFI